METKASLVFSLLMGAILGLYFNRGKGKNERMEGTLSL